VAKGDDIWEKLIRFGVDVIGLCEGMPMTAGGKHIAGQLLRCATSAAPNYAEARGAESGRDFVHKLGIVLKELNEAEAWIEMIIRSGLVKGRNIVDIRNDCRSLCRIIAASVKTASTNLLNERHRDGK
jgi:four helix bundle protein